jgi:hypothetical protein
MLFTQVVGTVCFFRTRRCIVDNLKLCQVAAFTSLSRFSVHSGACRVDLGSVVHSLAVIQRWKN